MTADVYGHSWLLADATMKTIMHRLTSEDYSVDAVTGYPLSSKVAPHY